jgi:hypothetical protein
MEVYFYIAESRIYDIVRFLWNIFPAIPIPGNFDPNK